MRTIDYNAVHTIGGGRGDTAAPGRTHPAGTVDTEAPCYGTEDDRRFFAGAYAAVVACYALMMAAYGVVFWHSADALLNIGVCVAYGCMYFGIPVFMGRMALRRDGRFRPADDDTRGRIRIGTGPVAPAVAFAQIVIIPAALALCAIGLVTVFSIVTNGHQP